MFERQEWLTRIVVKTTWKLIEVVKTIAESWRSRMKGIDESEVKWGVKGRKR